jgi:hypothetical protein
VLVRVGRGRGSHGALALALDGMLGVGDESPI